MSKFPLRRMSERTAQDERRIRKPVLELKFTYNGQGEDRIIHNTDNSPIVATVIRIKDALK